MKKTINRRAFLTAGAAAVASVAAPKVLKATEEKKHTLPCGLVELPKPVGWFIELKMDGNIRRFFYPAAEYPEEYIRRHVIAEGEPLLPWVEWRKVTPLYASPQSEQVVKENNKETNYKNLPVLKFKNDEIANINEIFTGIDFKKPQKKRKCRLSYDKTNYGRSRMVWINKDDQILETWSDQAAIDDECRHVYWGEVSISQYLYQVGRKPKLDGTDAWFVLVERCKESTAFPLKGHSSFPRRRDELPQSLFSKTTHPPK